MFSVSTEFSRSLLDDEVSVLEPESNNPAVEGGAAIPSRLLLLREGCVVIGAGGMQIPIRIPPAES